MPRAKEGLEELLPDVLVEHLRLRGCTELLELRVAKLRRDLPGRAVTTAEHRVRILEAPPSETERD